VVVRGLDGPFYRFDDHRVGVVCVVAAAGDVELEDLRRYGASIRVEGRGQGKIPALEGRRRGTPAAASLGLGVVNSHRGGIVLRAPFTVAHRRTPASAGSPGS
jgi:hypothetical protein